MPRLVNTEFLPGHQIYVMIHALLLATVLAGGQQRLQDPLDPYRTLLGSVAAVPAGEVKASYYSVFKLATPPFNPEGVLFGNRMRAGEPQPLSRAKAEYLLARLALHKNDLQTTSTRFDPEWAVVVELQTPERTLAFVADAKSNEFTIVESLKGLGLSLKWKGSLMDVLKFLGIDLETKA